MDKIIFSGNLGSDPEQKTLNDGTVLTKLNVAVSRKVKGEKLTEWRSVTCTGSTGKFCMDYLKKGRSVLIEGRPSPRAYKNKLEELVGVIDVWANNVEPLGSMRDENNQAAQNSGNAFVPVENEDMPF